MREWLVIENSWKRAVFRPDGAENPIGYIPRDVAEPLLGRKLDDDRCTWFTREEGDKMRAHPEWRDTEPPGAELGPSPMSGSGTPVRGNGYFCP
jgi:hypothetical protein